MHHIYHTNALILGSRNRGEANRMIILLTRELGLIHAVAQGVRLGKSKLRYALTDYAYAKVDLVRGREVWRITSATPVTSFPGLRKNSSGVRMLVQISKLLNRLIRGESEFQEVLFDDVYAAYEFLDKEERTPEIYEAVELSLVLRLLKTLGYVSDGTLFGRVSAPFDPHTIDTTRLEKRQILIEINRALKESHL